MDKRLNFTKEDIQIDEKHVKICLISVTRKCKLKLQ